MQEGLHSPLRGEEDPGHPDQPQLGSHHASDPNHYPWEQAGPYSPLHWELSCLQFLKDSRCWLHEAVRGIQALGPMNTPIRVQSKLEYIREGEWDWQPAPDTLAQEEADCGAVDLAEMMAARPGIIITHIQAEEEKQVTMQAKVVELDSTQGKEKVKQVMAGGGKVV